jgi:hypothetical protein
MGMPEIKMELSAEMVTKCVADALEAFPGKKLHELPEGEVTRRIVDAIFASAKFVEREDS